MTKAKTMQRNKLIGTFVLDAVLVALVPVLALMV